MVKRQTSAVDRYLDLPYHITLVQDGEENGGNWVAAAEELPDCTSRADTRRSWTACSGPKPLTQGRAS